MSYTHDREAAAEAGRRRCEADRQYRAHLVAVAERERDALRAEVGAEVARAKAENRTPHIEGTLWAIGQLNRDIAILEQD